MGARVIHPQFGPGTVKISGKHSIVLFVEGSRRLSVRNESLLPYSPAAEQAWLASRRQPPGGIKNNQHPSDKAAVGTATKSLALPIRRCDACGDAIEPRRLRNPNTRFCTAECAEGYRRKDRYSIQPN